MSCEALDDEVFSIAMGLKHIAINEFWKTQKPESKSYSPTFGLHRYHLFGLFRLSGLSRLQTYLFPNSLVKSV